MKATIEILSVREVKGFINKNSIYAGDPNRYNASNIISRSYDPKALFIVCLLNGEKIGFYSPTVVITCTGGMLNCKRMDNNDWFELEKGKITSYKGNPIFDGGNTPNVAVCMNEIIKPKIKSGDIFYISYAEKGSSINRVRILKRIK